MTFLPNTVEPVLKDHPILHKNMVSQDRWSLVTGSFTLKCRTFCQKLLVLQDRWSLMAVVSQDRFHCTGNSVRIIDVPVTIRVRKLCHFGQKIEFVTATKKHIYIKIKYLVDKSSKFCWGIMVVVNLAVINTNEIRCHGHYIWWLWSVQISIIMPIQSRYSIPFSVYCMKNNKW